MYSKLDSSKTTYKSSRHKSSRHKSSRHKSSRHKSNNKSNNDIFNISVICQFKNNITNLKLWLDHYIWQGIDHFYLVNTDEINNDAILEIINNYDNITYQKFSKLTSRLENYRIVYDKYKIYENTKWLISSDLDEFWYSKKSLKNELKNNNKYIIYSNYLMFGSNNLNTQPADIRSSIITRIPSFDYDKKWIIRAEKIKSKYIKIHNITSDRIKNDRIK